MIGERRSARPTKKDQDPTDEEVEQQAQRDRDVATGRAVDLGAGARWCRRARAAE